MVTIEMGWAARPFKDQFPDLAEKAAAALDADSAALTRLKIRGILTAGEHRKACQRFAAKVAKAVGEGE